MKELIEICKQQIASCPDNGSCKNCKNAQSILNSLGQIVNLKL